MNGSKIQSSYVSSSETRGLLAASRESRALRIAAADMVSAGEAARIAKASPNTVRRWAASGRAIGLTIANRLRMPSWQFDVAIWDALPKVSAALGLKDGWVLLAFLESPHPGLGGATPRAALEQGQLDRVLSIAVAEGL